MYSPISETGSFTLFYSEKFAHANNQSMNLKTQRNKKKNCNERQKGFREPSVATIVYYGPKDKKATNVVASVVACEDPDPISKWFSENDVRNDEAIIRGILKFLSENKIKSVVMPDRIIGCPHEEGMDYPEGEDCPVRPFWRGRDRWSGEREH